MTACPVRSDIQFTHQIETDIPRICDLVGSDLLQVAHLDVDIPLAQTNHHLRLVQFYFLIGKGAALH